MFTPIRTRLFAAVLFLALALVGLTGWLTWQTRQAALSAATVSAENLAYALAQHTGRTVEAVDLALRILAEQLQKAPPTVGGRIPHGIRLVLAGRLPQIRHLFVIDTAGNVAFGTGPRQASQPNVAGEAFFTVHRDRADVGLHIGAPIISRYDGAPAIMLSRRITGLDGSFRGVVAAALDPEQLSRFYDQIRIGSHGAVSLFRDDGILLVRSPPGPSAAGRSYSSARLFQEELPKAPHGTYETVSTLDGALRIISYRRVDGLSLVVAPSILRAEALASWRRQAWRNAAGTGAVLTVIALLAALLGLTLRRREAAEARLGRQNAVLDAILKHLPDGVQLLDRDFRMVATNDRFFEILELDPTLVEGAEDAALVIRHQLAARGDHGAGDVAALLVDREVPVSRSQPFQYRRRLATGKWIERRTTPMPDGGHLSTFRDIHQEVTRELDLRDAYVQLEEQARDLEEANRLAAEARDAAIRASRAKSEFLAGMSHELRTPMNAILGFSEIIRDTRLGLDAIARYREYAGDIHASGEHLLSLINDLLDLAKIEAGKMELREEIIDIGELVEAAAGLMRERAGQAGLELRLDRPETSVMMRGDGLRLKQCFINLLSNAVKFTPKGGQVTVTLELTPSVVAVAVADTGIGIRTEDLPKVFEPFGQINSSFTRAHKGTGLGMPLTRSFVELHDGWIDVKSTPGQGTIFTLYLPSDRLVPHAA